ncbi:hypothetical protein AAC387_Pa07g2840 [Persea americana]
MAEGKWVQVQSKRNKKYRKIRWEDLISVFVSNLPENTAVDWLRSVFSPYGYIYDAFIPAKSRRGKGFCFGFVRVQGDSYNGSAENEWEVCWRQESVSEGG